MPAMCRRHFVARYRRERYSSHSVLKVPNPGISDRVLVVSDHFNNLGGPRLLLELVLEFSMAENRIDKSVIGARSRISSEE